MVTSEYQCMVSVKVFHLVVSIVWLCLVTMDTGVDGENVKSTADNLFRELTTSSGKVKDAEKVTNMITDTLYETSCPEKCSCFDGGKRLRCDQRNLTTVPAIRNHQVELLNLSSNQIAVLSNHSFNFLHSLWRLHLEQNRISEIHPDTFHTLIHLCYLYLQHNTLSIIPSSVFNSLRNLTELDLSHNYLSTIPDDLFNDSSSLRRLRLSSNNFSTIPKKLFVHTVLLTELDLSHNPFHKLHFDTFYSLDKLQTLNLQSTRLIELDPAVLFKLNSLTRLDLSFSSLIQVNGTALRENVPRLQELDLSNVTLACSCNLAKLYKWLTNHSSQGYPFCSNLNGQMLSPTGHLPLLCESKTASDKQEPKETSTKVSPLGVGVSDTNIEEPYIPYDPLLGWYTAAVLGGMLIVFLLCLGMDKIKRQCYKIDLSRKKHTNEVFYQHTIRLPEDLEAELDAELNYQNSQQGSKRPSLVPPQLQVDSEPLVPCPSESDYVFLTPKLDSAAHSNHCLKQVPPKNTNKVPTTSRSAPTLTLLSGDVKYQILEIHPDCPLHSPRLKGRAPGATGTEETMC